MTRYDAIAATETVMMDGRIQEVHYAPVIAREYKEIDIEDMSPAQRESHLAIQALVKSAREFNQQEIARRKEANG